MSNPVITGHRGYKAKYVENTLVGFTHCYEDGATNIETDTWVTKDGIVVISHDVNTKRIFCHRDGSEADYNILKTNYEDLKDLVTIKSGEKLLKFTDMLNWYIEYCKEEDAGEQFSKYIQLDIKRFNPPKIMRLLFEDLLSVKDDLNFWCQRIQFGVWDINFLKYMNQTQWFQDTFDSDKNIMKPEIFHISFSCQDSTRYLEYNQFLDLTSPKDKYTFKVRGILMIYVATWSRDFLVNFVPLLKTNDLCLYSWTINNTIQYDYLNKVGKTAGLRQYGIITDDPGKMVKYKNSKLEEKTSSTVTDIQLTWSQVAANYMFLMFTKAAGAKRVTEDELDFEAPVDGEATRVVNISPFFAYIFFTLQKFGIF
ncbi:uncharacterized protein KQ657_004802 [Scheffersomyces spartinae]|uniref:GP-PDE domain-containing protein n=1 Tax=Scheffersomyces spartinae TaxID=45513 RepID=A0A9P7VB18_9ASCO|nr:uncharacterized protein KQ657_004802 [Scheffersomyces spartinae]KAG7194094.1 hypothetical protein KQ657_004802 [Scheffersomyces spartinae]